MVASDEMRCDFYLHDEMNPTIDGCPKCRPGIEPQMTSGHAEEVRAEPRPLNSSELWGEPVAVPESAIEPEPQREKCGAISNAERSSYICSLNKGHIGTHFHRYSVPGTGVQWAHDDRHPAASSTIEVAPQERVEGEARPLNNPELWQRIEKCAESVKDYPKWMKGSSVNERPSVAPGGALCNHEVVGEGKIIYCVNCGEEPEGYIWPGPSVAPKKAEREVGE